MLNEFYVKGVLATNSNTHISTHILIDIYIDPWNADKFQPIEKCVGMHSLDPLLIIETLKIYEIKICIFLFCNWFSNILE